MAPRLCEPCEWRRGGACPIPCSGEGVSSTAAPRSGGSADRRAWVAALEGWHTPGGYPAHAPAPAHLDMERGDPVAILKNRPRLARWPGAQYNSEGSGALGCHCH